MTVNSARTVEHFRLYEDGPSKPSINITMILGAIVSSTLHKMELWPSDGQGHQVALAFVTECLGPDGNLQQNPC